MKIAADDRARVPFALVGIVLLVGSAALSATLAERPIPDADPDAVTAIEGAKASTNAAIHRAVEQAAAEAGQNPLVEPAGTEYGRVLDDDSPFEDYLRVRIYLAVERALADAAVREGTVRASPGVPAVRNASTLRNGMDRVVLDPVGEDENGGLRVVVRGVTITAREGGTVVDRHSYDAAVVVSTPVLALHERTERFEERLDRGPLDGPGLGRRLAVRTAAVAWARGYAQYGGAPIENVLANRHVELVTNGAVLAEQREAFGRSDPVGRRAMTRATARAGLTDLLAPAPIDGDRWVDHLLGDEGDGGEKSPASIPRFGEPDDGSADEPLSVGVDRSADAAFARLVGGETDGRSLAGVIDAVYSVDVRLDSTVRQVDRRTWTSGGSPPEDARLVDRRTETNEEVRPASGESSSSAPGWDRYDSYARTVVRTDTTTRRWWAGNRTVTTRHHRQTTYRVTIDVLGKPAPRAPGPDGQFAGLYEHGGPLDGPNMREVPSKAIDRLVTDRGGPDVLARRAVDGSLDEGTVSVRAERPDGLSAWVYADLAELRDRVRNESIAVERRSLGTGRTRPATLLAAALRDRRAAYLDAPETYGSAADRARVAARAAYLDAVLDRLDGRARQSGQVRENLDGSLVEASLPGLERIERISEIRTESRPERSRIRVAGPDRELPVRVDADPAYLTIEDASATTSHRGAYHPLVARNVNVFTTPYGDVADVVADGLFDGFDRERVDLRTAALVLRETDRTLENESDPELARSREELATKVDDSLAHVRQGLAATLARETALDWRASREAVDEGFSSWDGTADRALAAANGSAADPVASAAVARLPESDRTDRNRDWIALRVRLALDELARQERVRPPEGPVDDSASRAGELARDVLADAVENGLENASERARDRWFGESLLSVPSGLPVTPIPGYWYATINVWHVEVVGTYAAFSVRAPHATPASGPDATVAYERGNRSVELDVDGDGEPDHLGWNRPVSFRTSTAVLVVVPPGGRGVGDVNGDADERSPGWPEPGPE